MTKLDNFIGMMTGHFDNKEQFNMMQATGKIYPYAKHVNTVCNDKINNIPQDFNGKFVVEESYYETNGNRHASPHLFLITENEDGILLSSYEIPEGEDNRIFQRFYRGSRVTGEPGFGLGLYISREIVTLHGGFMKAKRKEQGLEVAIFLPV